MIGQTISHYRILDKLGEGGMGSVYVAEDIQLGRRVAIKFPVITTDEHHYRARFLREARSVSMLSHPHIAAIYDYGETNEGQPFLVMELVNGPPLSDLLHSGTLTLMRAVEIIRDVAKALAEAHHQGIVHRDIKPSNVLLNHRGEVKVLDFGLAKLINEENGHQADPAAQTMLATRTRSGTIVGTPLYLSPEQATGTTVDGRSDLFTLGALLYECIAGRPAFEGASVIEIAAQVLHINPPPPSTINPRVPPELDQITMKALAKKPEERYQSADEMIADLQAVWNMLGEDTHPTQRLSIPARTGRTSALTTLSDTLRRPRLSLAFFLIAVVVPVLLILGYYWSSRRKPHVPLPEAQRWYEVGTNALRDGAYYQASKAFEQAISADDKFALAHARLAEAWTELDYGDRAKDELLRVTELEPDTSVLPQLDALYLEAVRATILRDFERAVKTYAEIARLKPELPQAYVDLGRAYENSNDLKKAIESYVKATKINAQYPTPFMRVGILYGRQQDLASAKAAFDKADALYQVLGNIEGQAEVHFQRGFLFRNTGKIAEARAELEQALNMARATNNQPQQIRTLLQLSTVSFAENSTNQAQQYAREAIDLAQAGGMENLIARGLVDLGNVYFARGDYTEAENYFKRALEFAQRFKAQRSEARARINLGSLRISQGNVDEGVRYVEQALAFYQQGGYRKEAAQALTMLGRAHSQKGDYDAALKAYQQQLQIAEQVGDQSQVLLSHEGIGTLLAQQERYPEALNNFEAMYNISKSLNDQLHIGYSLVERAGVLGYLGRFDEARDALGQVLTTANKPDGGDKALLANAHQTSAEVALSERRLPEAKEQSQQALALSGTQYPEIAIEARRINGLAQSLSGAKVEGRRLCEEALEMATRLGDPWLLSRAQAALATATLENGDAQEALTAVLRAQESFARRGQQDSEWRAWLVAARASQRKGDAATAREYATRAAGILDNLQQRWGTEAYNTYLTRPDVQYLRQQLGEVLTVNQ
jgi:serine/threonine protein kinase/Tfp pilus assembly protein PilF